MDTTNKLAEALQACPFCGGEGSPHTEHDNDWPGHLFASIKCRRCGSQTGSIYGTGDPTEWAEARALWNRRLATPSADQATQPAEAVAETEQSIAADSYWNIAETLGTLDGYSVQEHVQTMREVMQRCSDYLHDIHGSSEGGDDEGVLLAADVRNCLSGHIDLVSSEPTELGDES